MHQSVLRILRVRVEYRIAVTPECTRFRALVSWHRLSQNAIRVNVHCAGDRKKVYVTNVVKHFKWEPRGKRRIHKKPNAREIDACRPWLDAEITAIQPAVIVCLGATAARALLGKAFRVTQHRGEFVESPLAPHVMATVHPSSILRAQDEKTRHEQKKEFVRDMRLIAKVKS